MGSSKSVSRGVRGFTLIELTVVLAVLVTLALIITPSITNFISDSRTARTQADTKTIASALVQFYKDNGFYPQWSVAEAGGPGTATNKVDLLVSDGNLPAVPAPNTWTTGKADVLTDQLLSNAPSYTMRTAAANFGWNGPYLSSPLGADAWNNRYSVNIGLIDATAGTQGATGAEKNSVWVLSAGPNGAIDTSYTQSIRSAVRGGDDIGVRLQ